MMLAEDKIQEIHNEHNIGYASAQLVDDQGPRRDPIAPFTELDFHELLIRAPGILHIIR